MVPEIGHYCLIVAFSLAIIQAILPLWGSFTLNARWMTLGSSAAWGQFLFVGLSFSFLAYSFMTNDFSLSYVAQNSNTRLPLIYRFCATWGAHEGSLLLWVLILSLWTVLVSCYSREIPKIILARVLSVLAMVAVGFYLFLLTTSNPFRRLLPDVPLEGFDLNPLLQDPGLAIHPPMLYMGYVGFAVAFAFAITALISGKFEISWARAARPWTLLAWSFLTLGITLGSWWAYRVLGWGGWWFWDPVENASFLPWLAGTALLHSLVVAQKRNLFKAWTVLLAVCTFSLSLMGTFLVRSGILVSVHAFAVDPARGAFMLYFLAIAVGGSLLLYAFRGHMLQTRGAFEFCSRETILLSNNVILVSCMLTVLLGTLYPLIIDALGFGKLSVGPPYFNAVFMPLMLPLLFLMGFAPALHWQKGHFSLVISRFKYTLLLSMGLAFFLPWILTGKLTLSIFIGLSLAFWIILATLQHNLIQPRQVNRRYGMMLAHIGFAICVIGIVITSVLSTQRDISMAPGDSLQIGPYAVQFNGATSLQGPNYRGATGQFIVTRENKQDTLAPQLRIFETQKMAIAKTAIKVTLFDDLYIALGEALEKRAWSMRVYYKPFIRWIWLGGLLMLLGGLVSIVEVNSRKRSETPK